MDMNFTSYVKGCTGQYEGIGVASCVINVSRPMIVKMPERFFKIEYDREALVIKLLPQKDKTNAFELKLRGKGYAIAAHLKSVMPIGRYYFTEKTDDGYLFQSK
jgi:hypothetical protein